ncbi:hypothetical protein K504DRAFT_463446 [Pleomassaria siparia CBS 279.74]|uniref:Uncharacterized protein n=1 Tax=Pleomassaria siparia CBS 279.74 TaxID=1314801 RepID=A0A6G1JSA2_9PLEO|nr:hypothetical protein K504DRAFT_463446 [Pleomassaria siparia CBS 279.74]
MEQIPFKLNGPEPVYPPFKDRPRLRHESQTYTDAWQTPWNIDGDEHITRPRARYLIPKDHSERDNVTLWTAWENIPQRYHDLFTATKRFVETVHRLSELPGGFEVAAVMLAEFSSDVLRREGSCFSTMLNSQRSSIYALLDAALLRILLDKWLSQVGPSVTPLWDRQTKKVRAEIEKRTALFSDWVKEDFDLHLTVWPASKDGGSNDGAWMKEIYFDKSRAFLEESLLLWKIDFILRGKLPPELLDEVLQYIDLPTEDLISKYSQKGKRPA